MHFRSFVCRGLKDNSTKNMFSSKLDGSGERGGGGQGEGRRGEDWMILGHIASRPWVSPTVKYG